MNEILYFILFGYFVCFIKYNKYIFMLCQAIVAENNVEKIVVGVVI